MVDAGYGGLSWFCIAITRDPCDRRRVGWPPKQYKEFSVGL